MQKSDSSYCNSRVFHQFHISTSQYSSLTVGSFVIAPYNFYDEFESIDIVSQTQGLPT